MPCDNKGTSRPIPNGIRRGYVLLAFSDIEKAISYRKEKWLRVPRQSTRRSARSIN